MNNDPFSSSAPPDYLEKYSLSCAPFAPGLERKFFYGGTALMQRLDLLTHLTQFGEPLVVVTGPPGSGKTTLLGQFAAQANSRWYLCLLHPDAIDQLPAHLSTALGGGDVSTGIAALLDRWDTETDASQLFVIIVDDADQLDPEACRLLCDLLDKPQGERVRVLLFGTPAIQPRLKETLAKLGSIRTPQVLDVPRLSEEETAAYLLYRLAVAGYSGESPFSATEVRGICKAADGWPGPINQFADQTLREHMMRARSRHALPKQNSLAKRTQLWQAVAGIAVIAIAYFGWQAAFSPEQDDAIPRDVQLAENETRLTLPAPRQPDDTQQPAGQPARPVPEPTPEGAPQETPAAPPMESAENAPPPAPEQEALGEAVPLPLPSADQPLASAEAPAPVMADAEPPVSTEAQQPLMTDQQAPAASEAQPVATVDQPVAQVPEAQPAAASEAAPATATATLPHREAWLLEQPGDHFSLQLLGSRSEQSVTSFIKQHKLDPAQTAYYRGLHKGSDWFVLMYGAYPSREAAQKGLASLPENVRKAKPWPRELKAVQQSIREAKP